MLRIVTVIIMLISAWAGAQAPAVPVPAYPSDGAGNVTVFVTLKWKRTAGAEGYHVQLARDLGFADLLAEDSAVADTSLKMGRLPDSTRCYWRVRARGPAGWGSFSKIRTFTTQPPLGAGPVLVGPPDYAVDLPTTVDLAWEAFPGAVSYQVQVSLVNNFATLVLDDSTLKTTSRRIGPLQEGTGYFWHVRALGPTLPGLKTAWTKGAFSTAMGTGIAEASRAAAGGSIRVLPGGVVEVEFRSGSPGGARRILVNPAGRSLEGKSPVRLRP